METPVTLQANIPLAEPLRLVVISDTHNVHDGFVAIPEGDVLIHCGDFTHKGSKKEVEDFDSWVSIFSHPHKLVVCGNHDVGPFKAWTAETSNKLLKNCTVLDNSSVTIKGIKIYGSGWNRKRAASRKIPDDAHVLITHSPPGSILSEEVSDSATTEAKRHFGCEFLRKEVEEAGKANLKAHLFGHVHERHGIEWRENILYVNASSVGSKIGRKPQIQNSPIVIDIV
mmetsp:Transcript_6880/g.7910  ORF Transcript_6880/g.7910 Transcript_6880/m.7910 type:complete len:227 (+) Transcript_6880:205-885(+)|eukprot:CAMPEP_0184013564 /NCGR_PEP_ID=MMETSP0954-20121128/5093_1 /TAXON_ID=627963 /ORGANISM="Aplanochytrium sp, Strain PBS07" /LENGTH=226 /DNA_ID=CAMNT_0026293787 /DNA_START=140 /DNA_END=820 /DNA_ORIENTATION=+